MALTKVSSAVLGNSAVTTAKLGTAPIAFANSSANVVYMATNGNIGIGISSPSAKFHVAESSGQDALSLVSSENGGAYAATLRLSSANATGSYYNSLQSYYGGAMNWQITGAGASNTIAFGTGSSGTERMRINSAGDVGIGTNSPLGKTDIRGNFYINNSTSNQSDKRAFFQTITGVLTSAASGTAKSIAYVFHHHCIRIYIMVSSQDNNCSGGTWIGRSNFVCGSGSTTQETTQTYYSGGGTNLTGISVNYQNGSGENSSFPNYIIRVTNTYTGTTPLIWYAIQGIAADTMVALQN